jgi:hypothetical protein
MTPEELLKDMHYAVIRVDENGKYRWTTNAYVLEGSALSDAETMSEGLDNGDHYEVVVIDHTHGCDHFDTDADAIYARAFKALIRYMFCGLRQMDEQLDCYSTEFRTYRELLCFAEGYLSAAGVEIAPIVAGVDAQHHV